MKEIDLILERLDKARARLHEVGQGRAFDVGVLVLYNDQLAIVTDLNKDSTDPTGSTIDIRFDDGTTKENVSVTSENLQRYRA